MESAEKLVLKNGVYAIKRSEIDDDQNEFDVNTRTEWRVIYVDPFKINIMYETPYSIGKSFKKAGRRGSRNFLDEPKTASPPILRDTDLNHVDCDDDYCDSKRQGSPNMQPFDKRKKF